MVLQLRLPIRSAEAVPWERLQLRPIRLVVLLRLRPRLLRILLAVLHLQHLQLPPIHLEAVRWKVVRHRLLQLLRIRLVHPPRLLWKQAELPRRLLRPQPLPIHFSENPE
jgi:hypothetical protein